MAVVEAPKYLIQLETLLLIKRVLSSIHVNVGLSRGADEPDEALGVLHLPHAPTPYHNNVEND
jgi:hypothetical protein